MSPIQGVRQLWELGIKMVRLRTKPSCAPATAVLATAQLRKAERGVGRAPQQRQSSRPRACSIVLNFRRWLPSASLMLMDVPYQLAAGGHVFFACFCADAAARLVTGRATSLFAKGANKKHTTTIGGPYPHINPYDGTPIITSEHARTRF